mgnify:CR=1 FL=1
MPDLPIRPAVLASPDYPFSAVTAPIKLDQNESFEDFPAELKDLALERLRELPWHRYTDLNADALCNAVARHDGWAPEGTVVTTGSNVLIALLIQLSAMGGGRVLTVKPNFALYGLDARLLGAELTEVPLREDQSVDFDALIAALGQASGPAARGVIYLPRPHAPTGSLCSLGDVERLALASQGWLLVIDEAYHHFMDSEDARALARRHPHVVLLRTLSKAWGLAGLRMGYALTSDGVARQLRKLVPPFGVSVLQTVCTLVALEHPGYVQARVAHTLKGTAGSIGATALQAEAAALEQALHERAAQAALEPLLQVCLAQLEPLVSALASWLAARQATDQQAPDAAALVEPPDAPALRAALQRLERLLQDSDSAAEQAWDQDAALFRFCLGARWGEVDAALRGFDYEQALQVLREAAPVSGVTT